MVQALLMEVVLFLYILQPLYYAYLCLAIIFYFFIVMAPHYSIKSAYICHDILARIEQAMHIP